ncbi:hypothetical protein HDU92_006810 [Lobulomyces angularis]|nr:hypothetical protein HDU92_006810 [Lobulomyces angularis]
MSSRTPKQRLKESDDRFLAKTENTSDVNCFQSNTPLKIDSKKKIESSSKSTSSAKMTKQIDNFIKIEEVKSSSSGATHSKLSKGSSASMATPKKLPKPDVANFSSKNLSGRTPVTTIPQIETPNILKSRTKRKVQEQWETSEFRTELTPSIATPYKPPTRTQFNKSFRKRINEPSILPFLAFFTILVVLFAEFMINNKLKYCGPYNEENTYEGWNPVNLLFPNCLTCPTGARCIDDILVDCEAGTIKKSTLIQKILPAKFLPFPFNQNYCAVDEKKLKKESLMEVERKKKLKDIEVLTEFVVRSWLGKLKCLDFGKEELKDIKSNYYYIWKDSQIFGMPINLAKNLVRDKVLEGKFTKNSALKINNNLNIDDFENIWDEFLILMISNSNLRKSSLVLTRMDPHNLNHRLIYSKKNPIENFSCTLKLKTLNFLKGNLKSLSIISFITLSFFWIKMHADLKKKRDDICTVVVDDVFTMVAEECDNHFLDNVRHPIPGLAIQHLRDFLLRTNKKPSFTEMIDGKTIFYLEKEEKDLIWKKVSAKVLENSNIRETCMEVNGEPQDIWQWIGSAALSPSKKKTTVFAESIKIEKQGNTVKSLQKNEIQFSRTYKENTSPLKTKSDIEEISLI